MLKNPITGEVLPKDWKILRVDEIKSNEKYACVAGPFGSDISSKYFVEKGTPVIRGNNLTLSNDKFKTKGFVFVSKKQAQNYKGQHVKFNDLVFTCWGTIGQVGIIPENGPFDEYIISNKQLKLRVNEEKVNPTFIYYYFSTKSMVKYISNIAIGSAVPGINLGLLKNLPVVLPPKNEQDCIAKSLDYFFDLIENNNQRITLLEEMAREIYKEWFVRFRFPGYKDTKFLDTDGNVVPFGTKGAIPEGWERNKLEKVVDFRVDNRGRNPEYYCEKGIPVLDNHLITNSPFVNLSKAKRFLDESLYSNFLRKYLEPNDVLITLVGTVGDIAMAPVEKCAIIQNTIGIRCNDLCNQYFLYEFLKINKQNIINKNRGSAQPNVKVGDLLSVKMDIPSKEILDKYELSISAFYEQIKTLGKKNQLLQETRDLLLPRLISGKLSVDNLEVENINMAAEPETKY